MNTEYFTEYEFECALDSLQSQYEWFNVNEETIEYTPKDPDYIQ